MWGERADVCDPSLCDPSLVELAVRGMLRAGEPRRALGMFQPVTTGRKIGSGNVSFWGGMGREEQAAVERYSVK